MLLNDLVDSPQDYMISSRKLVQLSTSHVYSIKQIRILDSDLLHNNNQYL